MVVALLPCGGGFAQMLPAQSDTAQPAASEFYRVYTWEIPSPCPPPSVKGYFTNHADVQIPSAQTGRGYLNDLFYDDVQSAFQSYDFTWRADRPPPFQVEAE
jgi:hypothetical protein